MSSRRVALIVLLTLACTGVPENLQKLEDAEAKLRANPHDAESLDFILGKLDNYKKITRNNAAAVLRLVAADPKVRSAIAGRAVPALIEVAQRHDGVESEGITALGEFREYGAPAVPVLVRLLSEGDTVRVQDATIALGNIGRASAPAVPLLRQQLRSNDDYFRIQTALAIRRIAPDDGEAMDNLIELLRSSSERTQLEAIMALRDLGPLAVPALPALEAYQNEKIRDDYREEAGYAMRSIKGEAVY
jgi:hypothetical protein